MPNDFSGPHIAAAFLCDKVLQERDGVLSFIRAVDRFTITGSDTQMPPSPIQTTLVISFKSGALAVGTYKIKIQPQKPDGTFLPEVENRAFFDGKEEGGVNIIAPMGLIVSEEGLYWINVFFEDVIVTRIPLRVLYQRVGPMISPGIGQ